MGATTLVPLDEYLRTSYDPDMEYVDGVLVGRNLGTQLHGLLQLIVGAYFHEIRKQYRIKAFTETRLRMNSETGRHCIPDVMVVELPYQKGKVITDVPVVVVEIKSPDDTLDEVFDKCLAYAALGIPNIVVLDPDYKRQYLFANAALQLVSHITLHLNGVDLPFPVDDMFAELDEEE